MSTFWQVIDGVVINMDMVTKIVDSDGDADTKPITRIDFVDGEHVYLGGEDRDKFWRCIKRENFTTY